MVSTVIDYMQKTRATQKLQTEQLSESEEIVNSWAVRHFRLHHDQMYLVRIYVSKIYCIETLQYLL